MRLNDFMIPGNELSVTGNMRIETESLAGNGSASARANNGIKPKVFGVNLQIAFINKTDLTALISTAEAVDENGKLIVYDVVELTLNVANVRQVQFSDNVKWREIPNLDAWRVGFTLTEYNSVPERVEERIETANTQPQSAEGETSEAATDNQSEQVNNDDDAPAQELTGFEQFLSKVDKSLE